MFMLKAHGTQYVKYHEKKILKVINKRKKVELRNIL